MIKDKNNNNNNNNNNNLYSNNDTKPKRPIYQLIKDDENIITYNDNNSGGSVSISFFGNVPNSTGRLFCPNVEYLRNEIHNYVGKTLSKQGHLNGSMVVQRNHLKIQHFCLDFDLKNSLIPQSRVKMNIEDFKSYIKLRKSNPHTLEYKFISTKKVDDKRKDIIATSTTASSEQDEDDDEEEEEDERGEKLLLNINYIIYEIIILLRYLGISDDDIFILGKEGGCFEKGFHIEIPSFLMNYHDLALFYEIIHSFIKNDEFLDATLNYSAFGSTKLANGKGGVYLPYCCFLSQNNHIICEKAMFASFKDAFNFFNIFKPLIKSERNIHYLDIIYKKAISSKKEKVLNLIQENEQRLKRKKCDLDTTIPYKYQKRHYLDGKSNNEETIIDVEMIQDLIRTDTREKKKKRKNDKNEAFFIDDDDDDDDDDPLSYFCENHLKNALRMVHIADLFISGQKVYKIFKLFLPALMRRTKMYDDVQETYRLKNSSTSCHNSCYACRPKEKYLEENQQQRAYYHLRIISNVLKKYPNTLDPLFIFGEGTNRTVIINQRRGGDYQQSNNNNNNNNNSNNNNNNRPKTGKRRNLIFYQNDNIFSDKHVINLYKFRDFEFTIHFLIAGYFSCLFDENAASTSSSSSSSSLSSSTLTITKMLVDWLWFLGEWNDNDKNNDLEEDDNDDGDGDYDQGEEEEEEEEEDDDEIGATDNNNNNNNNNNDDEIEDEDDDDDDVIEMDDDEGICNRRGGGGEEEDYEEEEYGGDGERRGRAGGSGKRRKKDIGKKNKNKNKKKKRRSDDYNNNDPGYISNFLQMYNHVRYNSKSINFSINWIHLCLKHLIVTKNVIGFEEALTIVRKMEGESYRDKVFLLEEDLIVLRKFAKKQNFTIRGATHDVVIPNIISAAILLSNNESIIYELLAIYVPIVLTGNNNNNSNNDNDDGRNNNKSRKNHHNDGGRINTKGKSSSSTKKNHVSFIDNKIVIWDGSKWKRYHNGSSNATISFHLPEIYYIANIQNQISSFKRELRKENEKRAKKNNENKNKNADKTKENNNNNNNINGKDDNNNHFNVDAYIKNVIIKQWYNNNNNNNHHKDHYNNNNNNNGGGDDYYDDDDDERDNNNNNLIPDRIHCISVNNITLNQILHKIQAYWAKTEIFSVPSLFITILLPDRYVLAGMSLLKNNQLITIKPVPMYFQEHVETVDCGGVYDNNDNNNSNVNNNLDHLLNHVGCCSFLNNQFFPLVKRILRRAQKKQNKTKKKREKKQSGGLEKKRKDGKNNNNNNNNKSTGKCGGGDSGDDNNIDVYDDDDEQEKEEEEEEEGRGGGGGEIISDYYNYCPNQHNNQQNQQSNNNNDNNNNNNNNVLFGESYYYNNDDDNNFGGGLGGNVLLLINPLTSNNNNNDDEKKKQREKLLRAKEGGKKEKRRRKKRIETKRDLHLYLTEDQCKREETMALIKLTKYFIIKQVANSFGDMMDVYRLLSPKRKIMKNNLSRVIDQYLNNTTREERNKTLNHRICVLADCYETIAKDNVSCVSFPPDIPARDMTEVECDCPLTRVCISLLQTFSYDVELLLYFFRLILRATCSDSNDFINKIIHIFLGETNSGKTTILQLFLSVVGNQAGILSPHTINHSSTIDRYHDLAKSYSFAKFWYMDEIANKPFNRQLINQITGNSRLFIRANYDSGNNVKLASTVLIFGNNKPTFTEQCSALINRLRYISFRSRFDSNVPVNFKWCQFPKLKITDRYQRHLELGMKALFLHAICHASCRLSSPFYLYDHLFLGDLETTQNITLSTQFYSPIVDIVDNIFLICDIVEDSTYGLTQKRMTYLLNGLDVVNRLNISSISDAITFISKKYPLIIIKDASLLDKCEDGFRDESVFCGIKEINIAVNDDRITYTKRKKMDDYSECVSGSSGGGGGNKRRKIHF